MQESFEAVYQDGVLRPLEAIHLAENQRVRVTIGEPEPANDDISGYFTPEEWALAQHDTITLEEVWEALSGMQGSLADACIAERDERSFD